jgi:hypothetical protein
LDHAIVVYRRLHRLPAWKSTTRTAPLDLETHAVIDPVAVDGMAARATPLPRVAAERAPATKPAAPR